MGLQFFAVHEALQDGDALGGAAGAEHQAFVGAGYGESVGFAQAAGHPQQAMSVGVGLDDRHDAGVRDNGADAAEIAGGGAEVQQGMGRARRVSKIRRHKGRG